MSQPPKELTGKCPRCSGRTVVENISTTTEASDETFAKLGIPVVEVIRGTERCPSCGFETFTPPWRRGPYH